MDINADIAKLKVDVQIAHAKLDTVIARLGTVGGWKLVGLCVACVAFGWFLHGML